MKLYFYIVLAALVLTVTDASAAGNAEALQKNFSKLFSFFYDFTGERRGVSPMSFVDDSGKKTTMDDYKGDLVILHFWATWCPPCVKELPTLNALRQMKDGKGLRIVPVSLDYGAKPGKISSFMKKQKLEGFPILTVPTDDKAWDQLTSFALPVTFIVDGKGRVLYKMTGDNDWAGKDTIAFIDNLLTNQKK